VVAERYVVDTSVVVRWYLPQSGWQAARDYLSRFLAGTIELTTTDCARFELPHVLRKHGLQKGGMNREQYRRASRSIDDLGIASRRLDADEIEQCAILADTHNVSFFDAVFVFECLLTGAVLLTSDGRLSRAAEGVVPVEVVLG
jgi:predicted nucleic acid-binding protein